MKNLLLSLALIAFVLNGFSSQPQNVSTHPERTLKSTTFLPEVMQFSNWVENHWEVYSKTELFYDASNQQIETITYTKEDDGSWTPWSRTTKEYDAQGNETLLEVYSIPVQQPLSDLKNGIAWEKTLEERSTFDDNGTLLSFESYTFNGGTALLISGERNNPSYDSQSGLLVENWHETYFGNIWRIDKKNKFFWNASNTIDSIDIYQYTGAPADPLVTESWELEFRYTADTWLNFDADEFLPYFESDNLERSTPNEVIGYDFSNNSEGELAMRYEGTFGSSQRVTIYSRFEDPEWIKVEKIKKIFDDRNNLIEEIESEWRTSEWVDIEQYKEIYSYNNGDIIDIISQEWTENDPVYKNTTRLEFFSNSTNSHEELVSTQSSITTYPNPSDGDINILSDEGQIAIYSATGKLMFEKEITTSSTVINVKDLPKGVYFITWDNKIIKKTNKLIVK